MYIRKAEKNNKGISSVKINVILNVIKQVCNIIFPLITYTVVTRRVGSDNLGRVSFADSFVTLLSTVAFLGISSYAIREGARIREDKGKIIKFSTEVFSINILSLLLSLIICFLLVLFVPRLSTENALIWILMINTVSSVLGRDWINNIYEDFLYITIRYIAFQVVSAILIIVFVRKPSDFILYAIFTVVANSGGYLTNIVHTAKRVPYRLTNSPNFKKHLRPILELFGSTVAITIYIRSDVVILGFLRSSSEVGVYTLASKIYEIIKALLNAIILAIVPRLANYKGTKNEEGYHNLVDYLLNLLLVVVFPCITGLYCLSEQTLELLGGTQYRSGSIALRILCISLGFAVFGCFFSQALLVVNRLERYYLHATIISAISNVALNFIFIPNLGIAGAAITTMIAELIVVTYCAAHSQIPKGTMKKVLKTTIPIFIGCGIIILICEASKYLLGERTLLCVVISILLSIFAYFFLLYVLKNPIVVSFGNKVKRFVKH